jgi:hypothetical protein
MLIPDPPIPALRAVRVDPRVALRAEMESVDRFPPESFYEAASSSSSSCFLCSAA